MMRELQLDGIHDDGEHVVLLDSDGESYTVRITEALRAAVRRDRPALGAIQSSQSAPLSPREIQAMLRSGHEAEEIAQSAGMDIERIRRFEGPVLAEREHMAERARGFHVGRGGGPSLDEVVIERLRARRASSETRWDAWREEDGLWTVELVFTAGGRERTARWSADMSREALSALDDEARWLTEEGGSDPDLQSSRPRLTAVRGRVFDIEADPRADSSSVRESHAHAPSALAPQSRPVSTPPAGSENGSPAWSSLDDDVEISEPLDTVSAPSEAKASDDAVAGGQAGTGPDSRDEQRVDDEQHDGTTRSAGSDEQTAPLDPPVSAAADDSADTPLPGLEQAGGASRRSTERPRPKRTKRSSIPSWDEIVFGSKGD